MIFLNHFEEASFVDNRVTVNVAKVHRNNLSSFINSLGD
jgi:hypothetical protein